MSAMKRGMLTAAVALMACAWSTPGSAVATRAAAASPSSTTVTGGFVPDRLGAAATMELGFQIRRPGGAVPPPLVGVNFHLPAEVSLTTSELGLDSCSPTTLAGAGTKGCRADAVMGYGSAEIVTPDAAGPLVEPVRVTVLMGIPENRHTTLLFYASGGLPLIVQQIFSGQLLEGSGSFGADLHATIPLTAGLPGEPDATVVRMQTGIGPKGVTYYKRVHGARVPYTPKGVIVPQRCPAGGFPFGVTLLFADGSSESASATAPCPSHGGHTGRRSK